MLNIAIPQIPFKGRLSIDYSFLIIVIGIGSTLGVIATPNDAMAQPFKESKAVDYLFKVSDSKATLANNPDGQCPEGTVQASPPLNPQLGCLPNNETLEPDTES